MPPPSTWTPAMLERVLAQAAALAPDAELLERDGWLQVTTPSHLEISRNGIFIATLDPTQADQRIADIIRYYASRNAGFRWIVGPSSAPEDLSDRLTRAGIPLFGKALGMHMQVPAHVPELPAGFELRPLERRDVDTYVDLTIRGWEHKIRSRDEIERMICQTLVKENPQRAWLMYEDGEPVGTTVLCVLPGVGYLQGGAVLPERRRRGLYTAMVHHRLALLRGLGIEHAVIWANESTSAGVCRRAGFVPLCRAVFHELPPPGQ